MRNVGRQQPLVEVQSALHGEPARSSGGIAPYVVGEGICALRPSWIGSPPYAVQVGKRNRPLAQGLEALTHQIPSRASPQPDQVYAPVVVKHLRAPLDGRALRISGPRDRMR